MFSNTLFILRCSSHWEIYQNIPPFYDSPPHSADKCFRLLSMTKGLSNLSSSSRYKFPSSTRRKGINNKHQALSYSQITINILHIMFAIRVAISTLVAATLLAGQAQAANTIPRAILIATDPGKTHLSWYRVTERLAVCILFSVAACNPPNNGGHTTGSSCKFFSGPSDSSPVISGSK